VCCGADVALKPARQLGHEGTSKFWRRQQFQRFKGGHGMSVLEITALVTAGALPRKIEIKRVAPFAKQIAA
jgi:hypothetical protein